MSATSPIGPQHPIHPPLPGVIPASEKEGAKKQSVNIPEGIFLSGLPSDAGVSLTRSAVEARSFSGISLEELAERTQGISQAVEVAAYLEKSSSAPVVSLQKYIEKNGAQLISNLIGDLQNDPDEILNQPKNLFKNTEQTMNTFLSSLLYVAREASNSVDFLHFQKGDSTLGIEALNGLKGIEVGATLMKLLGAGGSAIVIQTLINQAKHEIELKKALLQHADTDQKSVIEDQIKILEKWVKLHHYSLLDQIKETTIGTVLSLPRIGSAICVMLDKGGTAVGTLFSGFAIGAGVVGSGWELYKTEKDLHKQEKWSQAFDNNGLTADDAQKLVTQQHEIFKSRLEKNAPLVKAMVQPLIYQLNVAENQSPDQQEFAVVDVLAKLREEGLNLTPAETPHTPPIDLTHAATPNELCEMLLKPEVQLEFNKQLVQKKEVLSGSLRNALKTLLIKKAAIERGFLQWESLKLQISTAATVIMAGLWIAMKAAILPAIIGGAVSGLVISGYGLLALSIILLVVGLAYLYYKKPNVFMTMCKGVYIELVLRKIPLAIQQYRRQSALLDTLSVAERAHAVSDSLFALRRLQESKDPFLKIEDLPADLQTYLHTKKVSKEVFSQEEAKEWMEGYGVQLEESLKRYEEKMDLLNKKVLLLNESVEWQEAKVANLQAQVREAGWKDYQRLLREDMPAPPEDDAAVLAEFLLADETVLQDPQIASILSQMNVDLSALRAAPRESAVKEVAKAVQAFFAMDDRDLVLAIKTHKRQLKIAS